jgi:hypothetical protein
MKKMISFSLTTGLITLLCFSNAYADYKYFTLEGTAGKIEDPQSILDGRISEGDPITYVFRIDPYKLYSPVNHQRYGLKISPGYPGLKASTLHQYTYYTEFLGGTGLHLDQESSASVDAFWADESYNAEGKSMGLSEAMFSGDAANGSVVFYFANDFSLWERGGHAVSNLNTIKFQDDNGNKAKIIGSNVNVTSISDIRPIYLEQKEEREQQE